MGTSRRQVLTAALGAAGGVLVRGGQASGQSKAAPHPIGDEGVGPGEDLMREHGALNRILLIYDEGVRRIRASERLAPDGVHAAAGLIRRFIEEYHEKLEEDHLFPRFERAGKLVDLAGVLRAQHQAGRRLTAAILETTKGASAIEGAAGAGLAGHLGQFIRMYRPHEAREDTVLFPAFRDLVSKDEYERLGEAFEAQETKVLGPKGYERIVEEVAQVERGLGIYDLAAFTPRL